VKTKKPIPHKRRKHDSTRELDRYWLAPGVSYGAALRKMHRKVRKRQPPKLYDPASDPPGAWDGIPPGEETYSEG
jgi:hypothetical protein